MCAQCIVNNVKQKDKIEMEMMAAWRSGLHVWLVIWRSWIRAPSKANVVSQS